MDDCELILDLAPDVMLLVGHEGRIAYASRMAEAVLGYRPEELVGLPIEALVPPRLREAHVMSRAEYGQHPRRRPMGTNLDLRAVRKDGSEIAVDIALSPLPDGRVVAVLRDSRDRRRMERELRDADERLRAVLEAVPVMLFSADADGRVTVAEGRELLSFGADAARAVGSPLTSVFRDLPELGKQIESVIGGEIVVSDVRLGGRTFQLSMSPSRDTEGRISGALGVAVDVTKRWEEEERMADLALHDPLTRLANRALVGDRIDHALERARRRGAQIAVLFLDLDGFKTVNDTFGHPTGDDLLRAVAGRLGDVIRAGDTVGRIGGDEFVVVCEDVADECEVREVGERMLMVVSLPFEIAGRQITVGGSIGVRLAEEGSDAQSLLQDADAAMYSAKRRGGGVEVFPHARDAASVTWDRGGVG